MPQQRITTWCSKALTESRRDRSWPLRRRSAGGIHAVAVDTLHGRVDTFHGRNGLASFPSHPLHLPLRPFEPHRLHHPCSLPAQGSVTGGNTIADSGHNATSHAKRVPPPTFDGAVPPQSNAGGGIP